MRRLALLLVLALSAAPAFAQGEGPARLPAFARALELEEDYEYREAEAVYRSLLDTDADPFKVHLGLARCASGVGDNPRAAEQYHAAAELEPGRPEPARGLGHLAVKLDRREEARAWYEEALALDSADGASRAGLAKVAIEAREFDKAEALLRQAISEKPDSPFVLSVQAELLYRTGDISGATRMLRHLLTIAPKYLGAHLRLANGFLERDRAVYRPPEVPAAYDAEVRKGVDAYRGLDMDRAEEIFTALDDVKAADGRPPFYRGLVEIRRGRPRAAIPHLWKAVAREPASLLFRNALGVAYLMKIARQRAEYGGGEDGVDRMAPLIAALPVPEVPGIEKIVRGYERLTPAEQAVIRRDAAPLSRYLPRLRALEITHDILGLDERVCDAKERRYLTDRRTVDGRVYAGMRGLGGRNAATGLEAVIGASELRSDTFAHELMHQVHRFGLSATERRVVALLFERALASDLCLDYYAASNEFEYLAQGYEAFVSLVKSPYHYHLARHTRAELAARDPALHRFLLRITGTPDPDPSLRPIAEAALEFYSWAGDESAIREARSLFSDLLSPATTPQPR